MRKLTNAVFRDTAVNLVVQLRIEKDWAKYAAETLTPIVDATEEFNPSFLQIFEKIKNDLGQECRAAYVVCDEADLPTSTDEIRAVVKDQFGIHLTWKSDVFSATEFAALTNLDRSLIDFEMAVQAPVFIGLSRSTFSNMVSFELLSRRRSPPASHYIYNVPGKHLGRRCDNGSRIVPHEVTNRLYLRQPLAPPSCDDIHWTTALVAHIAGHGDLRSDAGAVIGVDSGALVCGLRPGDGRQCIEGFVIVPRISILSFQYRAMLADGQWTDWAAGGTFVGTRHQGRPLLGFAARLIGPLSLSFYCLCVGSFSGKPDLVYAGAGQDCVAEDRRSLEAMQIVFRRL